MHFSPTSKLGYLSFKPIFTTLNLPQRALYVGTTSKISLEQHHDLIKFSTTFQRCSNVKCPLGRIVTLPLITNIYFVSENNLSTFFLLR